MAIDESVRSKIAQALVTQITTQIPAPDIVTAEYDKIRLTSDDFKEWELPAVQIIDLPEVNVHEQRRGRKTWTLAIEMIVGNQAQTVKTTKDLWDLIEAVEKAIMQEPKLGLTQVLHAKILGSATDLHIMDPFYVGRLEIEIQYFQELVGPC